MRTNTALSILRSVSSVESAKQGPWHTDYTATFASGKRITMRERNGANREQEGPWVVHHVVGRVSTHDTLRDAVNVALRQHVNAKVNGRHLEVNVRVYRKGAYRIRRAVTLHVDGYDRSSDCPMLLSLLEGCLADASTFGILHDYLEENGLLPIPEPHHLVRDEDTGNYTYRGRTIRRSFVYWFVGGHPDSFLTLTDAARWIDEREDCAVGA